MARTDWVVAIVCAASSVASAQWSVTVLHPAGLVTSNVQDIGGGQQVGYGYSSGGPLRAALWSGSAGSFVDLTPPGWNDAVAEGVRGGQQVGRGTRPGTQERAIVWHGTAASAVELHPPVAAYSRAFGTSGTQQVGTALIVGPNGGRDHASLWSGTAASWVDLHPAGARESGAYRADGGQQVGAVYFSNAPMAALWSGTAASWVNLHPLGAASSVAAGVHAGRQVGYAVFGRPHAGVWSGSAASWQGLHPANATESLAQAIHGDFVAGSITVDGLEQASVWDLGTGAYETLNGFLGPGWGFARATGVWSDGQTVWVTGTARNNVAGEARAVLWSRPVPGPGVAGGLVMGLGVLGTRRRDVIADARAGALRMVRSS